MTSSAALRENATKIDVEVTRLCYVVGLERKECQARLSELLDERNRLLGKDACHLEVAS